MSATKVFSPHMAARMSALDIARMRREALRRLIDKHGGYEGLARLLEVSRSYVKQLEKGVRPITEKTARKIEEKLQLERWAMDQPPGERVPFTSTDRALLAETMRAVSDALEREGMKVEPKKLANLVAEVYEHSIPLGHVDQDYIARLVQLLT
jgi:transcriptional regulator with XRE-family HTH domain